MKSERIFKYVKKDNESATTLLVEGFNNESKIQIAIVTEREVASQSYFTYDNGISLEYIQLTSDEALKLADSIKIILERKKRNEQNIRGTF